MKHILFTFDYELFLGSYSGSIEKCVLEPTNSVRAVLERHGCFHPVIFLDLLWMKRQLEYENGIAILEPVKQQLSDWKSQGAYIFPHLHPHWLQAKHLGDGRWDLSDSNNYRMNSLSDDQRAKSWEDAMDVYVNYLGIESSCEGYRAGGWSIQPFEVFQPYFLKYGIINDFSVLPGNKSLTNAQMYDFTPVKSQKPYRFSNDPTKQDEHGAFVEFPISTLNYESGLGRKLLHKWLWKTGDRGVGDGTSSKATRTEPDVRAGEMMSIELMDAFNLKQYLQKTKDENFIQFISHPKMLSRHNIKTLGRYLRIVTKSYDVNFDFKRYLSDVGP